MIPLTTDHQIGLIIRLINVVIGLKEKSMKVGFLGLGAMGVGMAGCIVKKHSLRVFIRSPGKAADLVARGADLATSIAELGDCDVVCSMLSDDAAVEAVFLNRAGGNLPIRKGAAHLSHSTISPGMTARLASAHARQDIEFLSAPVLGRPDRAASGTLVGILAGPEAVVAACRPVIDAYASKSYWVGAEAGWAPSRRSASTSWLPPHWKAWPKALP